jgi:hypothetical protein
VDRKDTNKFSQQEPVLQTNNFLSNSSSNGIQIGKGNYGYAQNTMFQNISTHFTIP